MKNQQTDPFRSPAVLIARGKPLLIVLGCESTRFDLHPPSVTVTLLICAKSHSLALTLLVAYFPIRLAGFAYLGL